MSLEARNITAFYGKQTVVRDFSLEVAKGQVTVIIGPNGSGKSTLLRCLARAHRHHKGIVLFDGVDACTLTARDAAKIFAYVPQDNPMPFAFTVAELVGLSGSPEESWSETLETLALAEFKHRSVSSLSGGERQRAALARGLAQATPYLLLDEPTAHLDLRHQKALLVTLRQRAEVHNVGVLLVLHDLNLASIYGDNLFLINNGVLEASGPPEEVLTENILQDCYQTNVFVSRAASGGRPLISLAQE